MNRVAAARVCVVLMLSATLAGCWQIDDLADLPGGPHISEASAITEGGGVVGVRQRWRRQSRFRLAAGGRSVAPPRPASAAACAAAGINEQRRVVGVFDGRGVV